MQDSELPAWLICEDTFNKIKTELITEAMDTLQEAIDSKSIEIKGSLVNLPDKPSDTDMKMFIINRIIEDKESIMERYKNHVSETEESSNDPKVIQQKERLKKFLLSVEQISMLMSYSNVINGWMHDVSMQITAKEPVEVVKSTINSDERVEVIRYVLGSKKIEKEEVLTNEERRMLENAI